MLIDKFISSIKDKVDFKSIQVIVDIGSRDLEQSVELHSVFPKAKIYAFEPNPESYQKCLEKAPEYIKVYPWALLDYDGETSFYSVSQETNHGASSVFEPTEFVVGVDAVNGLKKIKVPCRRLDSWAKENSISKIDLAWVDVQGSELPTFRGFGKYLDKVQAIATESATGLLYFANKQYEPTNYNQLKEFFEGRGFKQVDYDQPWELECDTVWVKLT